MTYENQLVAKLKKNKTLVIVFCVYIILSIVLSVYHEPWRDEAQAWLIARDCSIKDILFHRPHLEGHPPVWHLLLAPFAKLGCNYEITLKVINISISSVAVLLILFKSPFKTSVKALLTFSYTIFYQMTQVSRPYSLMLVAFILLAITYKKRDSEPLKFILSLVFLCVTHMMGLLAAGLISAVWAGKIIAQTKFKGIHKDRRVWYLCGLLAVAILIVLQIKPTSDQLYSSPNTDNSSIELLISLPDTSISFINIWFNNVIIELAVFIAMYVFMVKLEKAYNKRFEIILPYSGILIFFAFIYRALHLVAVMNFIWIYFLWIVYDTDKENDSTENTKTKALKIFDVLLKVVLSASLICSFRTSMIDINKNYSSGRQIANIIKDNGWKDKTIYVDWCREMIQLPYEFNCYFDENIIDNLNSGDKHKGYAEFRYYDDETYKEITDAWKETEPDILIIGFFDDDIDSVAECLGTQGDKYELKAEVDEQMPWRLDWYETVKYKIYVKKDIGGEKE